MTLPTYLVASGVLAGRGAGDLVRLEGAEGRHAVSVRRTRSGQAVVLTDGAGRAVAGEVSATGKDWLDLMVRRVWVDPEPDPRFVLVQALAKGGRDDQAIEAATECGVDEVVPWQAARSIVQWRGERGAKARRGWDSVLVAATKQSRRTRRPVLGETATTEDVLTRVRTATVSYVLHEDAEAPLAAQALPESGVVLVIIGPEGGIAPEEVGAMEAAGARAVRLGATVLRASSAGPAALAVLSAARRWR